jgi:hypothetical protein
MHEDIGRLALSIDEIIGAMKELVERLHLRIVRSEVLREFCILALTNY